MWLCGRLCCCNYRAGALPVPLPRPCRYIANETPGTKQAKLRLLQQRGWVVLPLNWAET